MMNLRTCEKRCIAWRILLQVMLAVSLPVLISLFNGSNVSVIHAYTLTISERATNTGTIGSTASRVAVKHRVYKMSSLQQQGYLDETDGTCTTINSDSVNSVYTATRSRVNSSNEAIRQAWVDKSIRYYSTVMREERRKQLGQIPLPTDTDETISAQNDFEQLAYKHYFALRKVKDGKPHHAERIYRRIINELQLEIESDDHCDHAKFAVTTLLLALHMQRGSSDAKATRSVFLNFFRTVVADAKQQHNDDDEPHHQCACSAKVLQAFALFEMKQGNELKSLEIVLHAIRYDPSLNTILNWKQFRDVQARKKQRRNELV